MAMTRAGGVGVTSTYKKPKVPATTDLAGGGEIPYPGFRGQLANKWRDFQNWVNPPSAWQGMPPYSGFTPTPTPPTGGSGWLGMPPYSGFTPTSPGGVPNPALPPGGGSYYDTNPVNLMSVGRGITAGGGGRPAGKNPLNTNYRMNEMDMLKDSYKAYIGTLQDAGTAEDQIPTMEQWMQARFAAFDALGGSSNINRYNIDDYYKNFNREMERILNPRERPPEDQAGIQQSTPGGWSPPVNQRY